MFPPQSEREARLEEIEQHRKRFEEKKAKQQLYNRESSEDEEEEENPVNELLKTFGDQVDKAPLAIDSESDSSEEEEEKRR